MTLASIPMRSLPTLLLALLLAPSVAAAEGFFSCKKRHADGGEFARSEASFDLYNGLAYLAGTASLQFGANPTGRWSATNDFDMGIRSGLRIDGVNGREDADRASDVLLGVTAGVLPAASILAAHARTGDCVETWDMFTDVVESVGLTLFVTEAVKFAAGRARPYTRECDGIAPRDASCGSDDRHKSFFSGHASLAAAGAGLTCSFALRRNAWGPRFASRAAPCGLGIAAALTVGVLRVAADRHWGTDVLVGFGVGALVGYFDTWGPLDLLKFETQSKGRVTSRGMFLPQAGPGQLGARVVLIF